MDLSSAIGELKLSSPLVVVFIESNRFANDLSDGFLDFVW